LRRPHDARPRAGPPPEQILAEARLLADQGCKEITLLGQTVNSYRYREGDRTTRWPICWSLHEIDGPRASEVRHELPEGHDRRAAASGARPAQVLPYLHVPAAKRFEPGSAADEARLHGRRLSRDDAAFREMPARRRRVQRFHRRLLRRNGRGFRGHGPMVRECRFKNSFIFKYSERPGTVLARQLASVALRFSSFEFFWLAVVGLSLSAVVSVGSTFRGILAALLGMLIRTVGVDMVSATPRFTFDSTDLTAGINFIPAMIGLFGLSEVLRGISSRMSLTAAAVPRGESTSAREVGAAIWQHKGTIAGSSILGTFVGALPGAGADIAAWVAYGLAQRFSAVREKFGQGAVAGVVAPTSANNAAVAGAWIPALVLGIPGDSVTAIVLGALVTYNIQPGPEIFTKSPHDVQRIFLIALITQFLLIPCGFLGIRAFGWILRLPRSVVYTGVIVFSVLGAYAPNSSLFDIWVMVAFGVLGYFLERWRVPLAPLILGMILGPMVEENCAWGSSKRAAARSRSSHGRSARRW
jgi:hypothetical protein